MRARDRGSRAPVGWWAVGGMLAGVAMGPGCNVLALQDVGKGNAPGSPPDRSSRVSYGQDIQLIWDKNCASCHRTRGIADVQFGVPMHLTAGQSYGDLVNRPSAKDPTWMLVVPGDPEASLLYRKVRDPVPPVGLHMPLFQPPLLQEEIDLIRIWIDTGAEND